MRKVYAWPPVGLTAWEHTRQDPVSRSVTMFQGRARTSSYQRSRRLITAHVTGLGVDRNGAGYIENLKRLLQGVHLVRMEALPPLWHLASGNLDLRRVVLAWEAETENLTWTNDGDEMTMLHGDFILQGTPGADVGPWHHIVVTGLPPNTMVARPSQRLTVGAGGVTETVTVVTAATSDAAGAATVRVFEPVTLTGRVSIGDRESIVLEPLDMPRAVQPARGTFGYQWSFREVFADEYPEGWEELDPWS